MPKSKPKQTRTPKQTPTPMPTQVEVTMLIVFVDLTGYTAHSQSVPDARLAEIMDAYYERVAARVEAGGGRLVKFIGDGALIVFDDGAVERGVDALLALKDEIDAWFASLGWTCQLLIKAHYGAVIAGPFGAAGGKRFDVLGRNVNAAAMLDSTGVALSAEAFAKISPAQQKRFREHAPAAYYYVRREDPDRVRRR